MNMLYDSDSFVVVHLQAEAQVSDQAQDAAEVVVSRRVVGAMNSFGAVDGPSYSGGDSTGMRLARHGFEIVDKRSGKEVYLDGSWAELFQQQINAWQENTPTQDEVEDALEGYTQLAQNPVILH